METEEIKDHPEGIDLKISFGEGFLLVFAINDSNSFQLLKEKREKIIKQKKGENCPFILVGSKQDLESEREVSYSDAKALADSWGCEYIETSAKLNYNCDEIFEKLGILILNKRKDEKNVRHCCCCNIF